MVRKNVLISALDSYENTDNDMVFSLSQLSDILKLKGSIIITIPKNHVLNPDVWVHEFIEISLFSLSKKIFYHTIIKHNYLELNYMVTLGHFITSLTCISGINGVITTPEEYFINTKIISLQSGKS